MAVKEAPTLMTAEEVPGAPVYEPGWFQQFLDRNNFIPFLDNPLTRGVAQFGDTVGGTLLAPLAGLAGIAESKMGAATEGLTPTEELTGKEREVLMNLAGAAGISAQEFEHLVDKYRGDYLLIHDALKQTFQNVQQVGALDRIEQAELARLAGLRDRFEGMARDSGRIRTDAEYGNALATAEDTFRAFAENARMQSRQMAAARTGGALTGRQLQHERAVDRDLARGLEQARGRIGEEIRRRADEVAADIPRFQRSIEEEKRGILEGRPRLSEASYDWRDIEASNYAVRNDLASEAIEGALAGWEAFNPMNAVAGIRAGSEIVRPLLGKGKLGDSLRLSRGR